MDLSVCIDMIFTELKGPYGDRIRAARDAGAQAVEFHLWRDKPIDEIAEALAETGLALTGLICDPRRPLTDPANHAQSLTDLDEALAVAQRLGAQTVLATVSQSRPGVPIEEQRAEVLTYLRQAVERAAAADVTLVIEAVNTVDHPGVYLHSAKEALALAEAVDHPRLRVLYDLYHAAVMDEPADVIAGRAHLIAHVQAADFPGRHQPGTGAIDWRERIAMLRREGYAGAIGLEYRPEGQSAASVREARAALEG